MLTAAFLRDTVALEKCIIIIIAIVNGMNELTNFGGIIIIIGMNEL